MTHEIPVAYFASLTLENVKCFKDEQTIDLSNGNDGPAMWTVILGNNNTGKTTLLRCLADLEPKLSVNNPLLEIHPYDIKRYQKGSRIRCNWFINNECTDDPEMWGFDLISIETEKAYIYSSKSKKVGDLSDISIYGYGTNRRAGKVYLTGKDPQDTTETLFDDKAALNNIEEWLLQLFVAKGLKKNQAKNAERILTKIKEVLICGILPDVQDFDIDNTDNFQFFIKFKTDYGWVKLKELGYGYRSIITLVLDLLKKMFERYPESDNPLQEPAIVLIDEIDLHLHPEWQRNIIKYLSDLFPKTQFIVTAHSPLIVQSAENINLVILEKQDDHVVINQPDLKTYKGWTVEEILSDLMGLDEKVSSDKYLKTIRNFENALDTENYQEAKKSYDELLTLLHPNNVQRELLELQMSSLVPN